MRLRGPQNLFMADIHPAISLGCLSWWHLSEVNKANWQIDFTCFLLSSMICLRMLGKSVAISSMVNYLNKFKMLVLILLQEILWGEDCHSHRNRDPFSHMIESFAVVQTSMGLNLTFYSMTSLIYLTKKCSWLMLNPHLVALPCARHLIGNMVIHCSFAQHSPCRYCNSLLTQMGSKAWRSILEKNFENSGSDPNNL